MAVLACLTPKNPRWQNYTVWISDTQKTVFVLKNKTLVNKNIEF